MLTPLVTAGSRPGMTPGPAPGASTTPAPRPTSTTRSGATAGVGPSPTMPILHQTNLAPVNVCAIQLVQSPLHVRVTPELNHALIGAFFMGIRISHFTCLAHKILKVLPAAAAGQVLHDETILSTDRRSILVSTSTAPAAITATFKNNSEGTQVRNNQADRVIKELLVLAIK